MKKSTAIKHLGGTGTAAALALGISRQAVSKWPDPLPMKVEKRVRTAIEARRAQQPKQAEVA